jgi:hypothetical protein
MASVCSGVCGLRDVGAGGDAFGELTEGCDELREVRVFGVVRHATQVPEELPGIAGIREAARGSDLWLIDFPGARRPPARRPR